MRKHDPALDTLLDLDGLTLVVDPEGGTGSASWSIGYRLRRRSRMDWTARLRCMDEMASGWWDSITLIPLAGKSVAIRRIIVIASEPCGHMSTVIPPRCLQISGRKWTQF